MMAIREILLLTGFVFFGAIALHAGEDLLVENFDGLAAEGIAAQGGWADNSKTGTATVAAEGSASAPNHLELSEGGAVHHEIGSWTETADRLAVEFAFKRKSSLSGRNLQVSLRDPRGNSGLFLNIRGSGTSLDAGLTGEEPAQFPFAEELPKDTWLRVKMEWSLLEAKLLIRVTSADGIEYLNQSFELPVGEPTRIIIGSTPSTPPAEAWALDDLRVQANP